MESPLRSPKRLKLDQDQEQHHEAEPTTEGPAPLAAEDPLPPPPPPPPRQFTCRLFPTPQGCPFGDSCLFGHPSAPAPGNEPSSSNNLNKPIKPCTKFFSTSGCPYGKGCHFSHYVPRGLAPIAMVGVGAAGEEKLMGALKLVNMPETGVNLGEYKSRLCNWFGTPEGCRYGEKCHFAHGEEEILHMLEGGGSKDLCVSAPHDAQPTNVIKHSGMELRQENARGHNRGCTTSSARQPTSSTSKTAAAAAFGTSTRAIISIDADLAGPIIGRSGMHTKQIRRLTGAKLTIREHESDVKLRVVEMEGSFEQIKQAGVMVRQVLLHALIRGPSRLASHKVCKSKVCKNFPGGTCTFGSRCHFVHAGAAAAPHAEARETTTVAEA